MLLHIKSGIVYSLKFRQKISYYSSALQLGKLIKENVTISKETNNEFATLFGCRPSSPFVNDSMLSCLFSRVIGTNIPHSIYLSQSIKVLAKVREDQPLVCEVKIVEDLGRNRYRLRTTVADSSGNLIVDGEAVIMRELKESSKSNR